MKTTKISEAEPCIVCGAAGGHDSGCTVGADARERIEVTSYTRGRFGNMGYVFSDGSTLWKSSLYGIQFPKAIMDRSHYLKLRAAIRRFELLPIAKRHALKKAAGL